ncbi:T9SS type A sorting domain-containing protein [bacterium]|nr:T9SS type A sorting domain-containing protein [bacterium]
MKKILSSLPFALLAVALMFNGTALADCPLPDHDLVLGESMCITVCYNAITPVGISVPALGQENPPVIIIQKGCASGETSCDDPECIPPTQWCFDMLTIIGPSWHHNWETDSSYWDLLIANFMCPGDTFCLCVTFESVLPVEMTAFAAIAGDGEVQLNWTTATETANARWLIDRATSENGPWTTIHQEPGQGTVTTETHYSYIDHTVQNGETYWYQLTDISIGGARNSHAPISATPGINTEIPNEFVLKQNYPNPFNPSTTFEFAIAEPGYTTLKVFDLLGREVASVVEGNLDARLYQVTWNAGNLASGVYLYTLTSAGFSDTRKLLLMK